MLKSSANCSRVYRCTYLPLDGASDLEEPDDEEDEEFVRPFDEDPFFMADFNGTAL